MKIIKQAFALCVIVCFTFASNAQNVSSPKPLLFNNSAVSFQAKTAELDKAFNKDIGSSVQLNFANNFTFNGTILSSVQRYGKLSSIIIKY